MDDKWILRKAVVHLITVAIRHFSSVFVLVWRDLSIVNPADRKSIVCYPLEMFNANTALPFNKEDRTKPIDWYKMNWTALYLLTSMLDSQNLTAVQEWSIDLSKKQTGNHLSNPSQELVHTFHTCYPQFAT